MIILVTFGTLPPSVMEFLETLMFITVLACIGVCLDAHSYRQEGAIVDCTPRYVRNCKAYTARSHRGGHYTTNVSGTLVHPFAENVTVTMSYKLQYVPVPLAVTMNVCDVFKTGWSVNFIKAYSNVTPKCPLQVGTYAFTNIVLPPKDYPLPIPVGKNIVNISFVRVDTHELILCFRGTVYVT